MVETVRIAIKEGPVVLRNAPTSGVDACYPLWNGASVSEFFPPGVESANYVVTLEKSVTHADEVRRVEEELKSALLRIAAAWPFAGGSHMIIEARTLVTSPRFESNADSVEQQLLSREGLKQFQTHSKFGLESAATYAQPPLALAIEIAKLMQADFAAEQLLQYYHQAWLERQSGAWFISLYKILDVIKRTKSRGMLKIPPKQWSRFETLLNNFDLRHAKKKRRSRPISREDTDELYGTARRWISSYLKTKGLPVT